MMISELKLRRGNLARTFAQPEFARPGFAQPDFALRGAA